MPAGLRAVLRRPAAASYAAGWQGCLDALAAALAGSPQAEDTGFVARHGAFVRQFGLDQPQINGRSVQLQRQLMAQPVDRVWQLLAPGETPDPTALVPATMGPAAVADTTEHGAQLRLSEGGWVSWNIALGPGGARLAIHHEDVAGEPEEAAKAWRDHVAELVERLTAAAG